VALAGRYAAGRRQADRQTTAELQSRLTDLGELERLSILPLVERHTARETLRGEAGVSYLIRTDGLTLLFDSGLGLGRGRTALETNAEDLHVRFDDLDCLVISHLHADHVGGATSQLRYTFSLGVEQPVPRGLATFVPTDMSHRHADVSVVQEARVIGPGVAALSLPRMLFWLGPIAEQALGVNVRGRGLVLVTGCGHPQIERMLAAAERVVEAPVYAVIGGLHLPVHATGTPLVPQAVLGSPNWPWRPISEGDAYHDRGDPATRAGAGRAVGPRQHAMDAGRVRSGLRRSLPEPTGRRGAGDHRYRLDRGTVLWRRSGRA